MDLCVFKVIVYGLYLYHGMKISFWEKMLGNCFQAASNFGLKSKSSGSDGFRICVSSASQGASAVPVDQKSGDLFLAFWNFLERLKSWTKTFSPEEVFGWWWIAERKVLGGILSFYEGFNNKKIPPVNWLGVDSWVVLRLEMEKLELGLGWFFSVDST